MTLLVLSLVLPLGTQGSAVTSYLLSSAFLTPLYAYLISFFVISLWWRTHHLVFSYLRNYDSSLIRWNITFLLFIAILPFATEVMNAAGSEPVGVIFFGIIQIGAGITLGTLWMYAWGRGHLTAPDFPKPWERYVTLNIFAVPILAAVTIVVAFIDAGIASYFWLAMFIVPLLVRRRVQQ